MIDGDNGSHPQSPNHKDNYCDCEECAGTGVVVDESEDEEEVMIPCFACDGTGQVEKILDEEDGPDPDEAYDTRFED